MANPTIKIAVSQADATLIDSVTLTAGMVNLPVVKFSFSEEWVGLGKTAVVKAGSVVLEVLVTNNRITIPYEALETAGVNLIVGVYGTNTSVAIPTVWCACGEILDGTNPESATNPGEATPTLVEQMMEYAAEIDELAQTLEDYAIREVDVDDEDADQYGEAAVTLTDTGRGDNRKITFNFSNLKGNGIESITWASLGVYRGRIQITESNGTVTNFDALIDAIDYLESLINRAEAYAVGTIDGVDVPVDDPAYQNNAKYYAENVGEKALVSEGYAVGKQHGIDVTSGSPYYENNAKYMKDAAAQYTLQADSFSGESAAWATGSYDGGVTPVPSSAPQHENNAKYWSDTAKQKATEALQELSVSSQTIAAGSQATAEKTVDPQTGAVSIAFGIPKGDKGDTGDTGYPTDAQVATAVGDWLDDNVDPTTGYVLDRTLTQSNAAAPADLVGEQSAKFAYTNLEETNNALDWSQGYWAIADGTINTSSNTWIKTLDFISDDIVKAYTNSSLLLYLQAWDKTSGNYVGTWNGSQWSTTYTAGSGLLELDIVAFRKTYPNYKFTIIVISSNGASVNPSTNGTQIYLVRSKVICLEQDVSDLQNAVTSMTIDEIPVNKINMNSDLTKHYYLWQNGSLVSSGSSHYFVSQPIPIKNGDVVRRNVTSASGIQFGAYVKSDGTADSPASISTKDEEFTVERDGYISVNFPSGRLQNAMVTINTAMPEKYVPYFDPETLFSNSIHLNDTQLEDVRTRGSILNGKLIAYNGDSIAESRVNMGTASNGGAYAKLIADYVGGTYENRAISGGILASAPGDGGSTPSRCVVSDVTNMTSNADLICFEGGINDYWRDVPLGTYSKSDYTGTLDTTTICGALESIFRQAIEKWVGKPIVFVITHKITSTVYAQNNAGYTWEDVYEKMVGICKKYSIPYYDAFSESGLNAYNAVQNTNFLTSNNTGNPDGCHPNEAGYRRYYVPQLIALFESVMPVLANE